MTKRVAIYARFSSDNQNEKSAENQVADCRAYCERERLDVVAVYQDHARSGESIHGRDDMRRLLADAKAGAFDIVLAETMSRIGRDEEDRAHIRKRLTYAGIKMMTPTDGVVTRLTDGIKAIIDSQQLEDLRIMVRRGMGAVIADGRHAGGRPYGYRPIRGYRGDVAIRGELEIVEAEAEIVKRIYAEYGAGATPRQIGIDLNRDRVPSPHGGAWNPSTLNGHTTRGAGILQNEIYIGRIVWNKNRYVKNPDTGRRTLRTNSPDQWRTVEAPHLRIVNDAAWNAAQARKAAGRGRRPDQQRRPPRIFSGLLKCGACGSGMGSCGHTKGRARLMCWSAKERGTCTNKRKLYRDTVEAAVVDGLRSILADPDYLAEYVRAYNDERKRLAGQASSTRARLESRFGAAERELARLVEAIATGAAPIAYLGPRITAAGAERDRLAAELAALADRPNIITLHPAAIDRYRAQVEDLGAALAAEVPPIAGPARDELFAGVRRLVSAVILHTDAETPGFEIEIRGQLSELVAFDTFPRRRIVGGINGFGSPSPLIPPIPFAFRRRAA